MSFYVKLITLYNIKFELYSIVYVLTASECLDKIIYIQTIATYSLYFKRSSYL